MSVYHEEFPISPISFNQVEVEIELDELDGILGQLMERFEIDGGDDEAPGSD